LIEKGVGK